MKYHLIDEEEEFEERAAILEYDAGYTREEAERLAKEMVCDDIIIPTPRRTD